MKLGLVSNWAHEACGVSQFGRNWQAALEDAGHDVWPISWDERATFRADRILINWDSGTQPQGQVPARAFVYVHHWYRGEPQGLETAIVASPVSSRSQVHHLPYPVPAAQPALRIRPQTFGVTSIRRQGLDYLLEACARVGWVLDEPRPWRETAEEVARLSACAAVGLWYSDSPGRSLALATTLAARRPILLSRCPSMFEYAADDPAIYWASFTHHPEPIVDLLRQIDQDLQQDGARIPIDLADRWTWPLFVSAVEALW